MKKVFEMVTKIIDKPTQTKEKRFFFFGSKTKEKLKANICRQKDS